MAAVNPAKSEAALHGQQAPTLSDSTPAETTAPTVLDDLRVSSTDVLARIPKRQQCVKCKKSVMYFCYYCYGVVGCDRSEIPTVQLPVKLDVVKHVKEKDGKSTAVHAKILAPDDVEIHAYPDNVPDYDCSGRTLLLFPGEDARCLEDIEPGSFDRLVVIDGTWNQAKAMVRYSPVLGRLPKVAIRAQRTYFWRFQNLDDGHLATIEAIYHFYREYHQAYATTPYNGEYDDLLFYFKYFYDMIQKKYRESGKNFTQRYRGDYIRY
ncbi:DTW domain-containing protein [Thamnocephalis sphaerospora]|uniref:tRNA-uridine aminocarboxypropyltransferase 1 n=1 Tax=Thamnocephalis sphaerospora TaxID=78915 RepID=A0A4P9XT12_9FUNG|nr:DTW domain-containing protein [Thamnocephalis sphaerospora]|eukprot:RKP09122.1 DTW domain-containing protein [Thamnocephalis sphaerospora]